MTHKEAIQTVENNIRHQRRLLTLLSSKKVTTALQNATQDQLKEFGVFVFDGSIAAIRNWANYINNPELGDLGVRELRQVACAYHIPLYYRLTKLELQQEIRNAKERYRGNQTTTCNNA